MCLLHKRPLTSIGPQGFKPGLGKPFPSCPQECNEAALVWGDLGGAWNPGLLEHPWRRDRLPTPVFLGFPCGSAGKESACNTGDPGSIPWLRRSPGEGIGYPLQYSWDSLVAETVKNMLAMRETWAQSLSWEDPWRREWLPTSAFLPGKSHGQKSLTDYSPWGRRVRRYCYCHYYYYHCY